MKRQMVIGPLLVVAMASGISSVSALAHEGRGGRHGASDDCRDHEPGERSGHFLDRMAKELGLNAEQQAQAKKIIAAEKEVVGPLFKKLDEARARVREAGEGAKFDEAAVRAAAAKENEIRTELMVSHARTRSRISAILTAEQREIFEEMGPQHRGRGALPGRHRLPPRRIVGA